MPVHCKADTGHVPPLDRSKPIYSTENCATYAGRIHHIISKLSREAAIDILVTELALAYWAGRNDMRLALASVSDSEVHSLAVDKAGGADV